MELNAVPTICRSCGAYFHRFLDSCPECGWKRGSAFEMAVPGNPRPLRDNPPRQVRDVPDWLAKHGADRGTIATVMSELTAANEGEPYYGEVVEAIARWALDPEAKAGYYAALGKFFTHKNGRVVVNKGVAMIGTYQYYGGLPSSPNPEEVRISCLGDKLIVRTKRGAGVAEIQPDRILAISSWAQRDGGSSWVGISFGHVTYFPDTSSVGGALAITWHAGAGAYQTLSVGNRDGWSAKKGEPAFYQNLVEVIGDWANMAAVWRQAEVGLPRYATELGFRVDSQPATPGPVNSAASGSPSPDDEIRRSFDRLEDLHRAGYISDQEYAKKRAELLNRV